MIHCSNQQGSKFLVGRIGLPFAFVPYCTVRATAEGNRQFIESLLRSFLTGTAESDSRSNDLGNRGADMKIIAIVATLLVICGTFIALGGLHPWKYDATVDGISYERVRSEEINGEGKITIGYLSESTEIDGLTYVGWLHRRSDGSVLGGSLKDNETIGELPIPRGTWVSFDSEGHLASCHFSEPQTIQGHDCRGSGNGVKGPVVHFYPSGRLKFFFAPQDCVIQKVPCAGGLLNGVALHESGNLKSCTLTKSVTIDGRTYSAGTLLRLDEQGNPDDHASEN